MLVKKETSWIFICSPMSHVAVKKVPLPDIIYRHSPCPDGASCEILLSQLFPKAKFVPYVHGETKVDLEEIKDQMVWCADMCFPLPILAGILTAVKFLYIIDHHCNQQTKLVLAEIHLVQAAQFIQQTLEKTKLVRVF